MILILLLALLETWPVQTSTRLSNATSSECSINKTQLQESSIGSRSVGKKIDGRDLSWKKKKSSEEGRVILL